MQKIIKRDGTTQKFDPERINNAIDKGFVGFDVDEASINNIKQTVIELVEKLLETDDVGVEEIQDYILESFINGLTDSLYSGAYIDSYMFTKELVANAYNKYRKDRDIDRALKGVYESLSNDDTEDKTENANVNAWNPAGRLLHVAEDIVKIHSRNKIYSKDIVQAIDDGKIYMHDMNWTGTGSTTCTQIDLEKLFKNGFHTGHGYLREPGSIQTAFQLAAIAIQANQNKMLFL